NPGARRTRGHGLSGPKPPRPDDSVAASQHRPLRTLPNWNPGLMEEGIDLRLVGVAAGLVAVAGAPVTEHQAPGHEVPVNTTHVTIIYVARCAIRSPVFKQFQLDRE